MTMTKKQIVASLREQRASLLTRRDKLDEQIEQTETALAAFGVTNPSRPARSTPKTSSKMPKRTEAEREQHDAAALELAEWGGCSAQDVADALGLHYSTAWRILEDLLAADLLYREQHDKTFRYFPLATRPAGVNPATKLPNGPAFPDATDATGESARASVTT